MSLLQVLPGPLFNFSAFLGAVINGLSGIVVCWVGIFAPGTFPCLLFSPTNPALGLGVLLIFGVYPFWWKLSEQGWMKKALVNPSNISKYVSYVLTLYICTGGDQRGCAGVNRFCFPYTLGQDSSTLLSLHCICILLDGSLRHQCANYHWQQWHAWACHQSGILLIYLFCKAQLLKMWWMVLC